MFLCLWLLLSQSAFVWVIASARVGANLTTRASSEFRLECARRGKALYQEFQLRDSDDAPYPTGLAETMQTTEQKRSRTPQTFDLMLNLYHKILVGKAGFLQISSTSPIGWNRPEPPVKITSYISAKRGIFLADYVKWDKYHELPVLHYYPSEAIWWMWTKAVDKQQSRLWSVVPWKKQKPDYSKLTELWFRVHNDGERWHESLGSIIDDFTRRQQGDLAIEQYRPDESKFYTPFYIILGTAPGRMIMNVLIDNKVALNGKGVVSLSINRTGAIGSHLGWLCVVLGPTT